MLKSHFYLRAMPRLLCKALVTTSLLALAACGDQSVPEISADESAFGGPLLSRASTTPITPITPTTSDISLKLKTADMAAAFLSKATFGAPADDIKSAVGQSASKILAAEFNKQPTLFLPKLLNRAKSGGRIDNHGHLQDFWDATITGDDQLRQRMVFALSQIVVVNHTVLANRAVTNAFYLDALSRNAFGNYKQLLKDVTYTPAMGQYLSYLRNVKGDAATGQMPDENYAREILQLFTIGLNELNMNGTPKLGPSGSPIETYSNDDIVGLAKVFTGLNFNKIKWWNVVDDSDGDAHYSKMVMYPDNHSSEEKTFLGLTIPAGTEGDKSIDMAIDHIFNHPNVAPFISRQLIQRFTASHPGPKYIKRVATAFETGLYTSSDNRTFGTGERGDLKATIAAVLLDEQFYDDVAPNSRAGKLREPVLRFIHFARAFKMKNVASVNERALFDFGGKPEHLGQLPLSSSSVFNFYRPGYVALGSKTGKQGLTAPEFQIVNEGSVVGYANFMLAYIFNETTTIKKSIDSFVPDYSDELALADRPQKLIDHLDGLLTNGRINAVTKARILDVLNGVDISGSDSEAQKLIRVQLAVYMFVTSLEFSIEL